MTADILSRIDTVLARDGTVCFGETGDSMRWLPGMVICHRGVASGPAPRRIPPVLEWDHDDQPGFTVTAHYRTSQGFNACVRVTVYTEADRDAAEMAKAKHPYPGWRPRPASRCGDCNPHGNPEPLAVNGVEYRRRLRNRRKRR